MNRMVSVAVEHEPGSLRRAPDAREESRPEHSGLDGSVRLASLALAVAPFLAVAAAAALASGDDGLRGPALGVLLASLAAAGSAHRIATGGSRSGAAREVVERADRTPAD